jgi:ABC-2 type transport system permease protein
MQATLIHPLLVPAILYFVLVGSLKEFAGQYGLSNWEAFALPLPILIAVQGGSAGLNLVADIERGYFDRLLLTPAGRLSILIGAMGADFVRILVQATVVVLLVVLAGGEIATGVPGAVAIIAIASLWGLAYSALGFGLALKTGNAQATQHIFVLFLPLMFLTTAFAPLEALSGWLHTAAELNPITYLLRSMRSLAMDGWDVSDIGIGLLVVAAVGYVTLGFAFMAMRGRTR